MAKIARAILLDADAVICLLQWDCFRKVCRRLGAFACIGELVATQEVKGHRDRVTGRWVPFRSARITPTSVPRLVAPGGLTSEQYRDYLRHFEALRMAGRGERETFALAWALDCDVCSRDTEAREIFFRQRPEGCSSRHLDVMELLRLLGLAP
jgi:hypothetical protein